MMITVWSCTFPAMFFGMWNTGYQANLIFAQSPELLAAPEGWRFALIGSLAGFDPSSLWDNFIQGAAYFLPVYAVIFIVRSEERRVGKEVVRSGRSGWAA